MLLGGCPAPGPTGNPLDTPLEGPPVVSVCYAPLVTDRAGEIEPVARTACADAGVADATLGYWKRTAILNDCPLLKKSRIAYVCLPAGDDASDGAAESAAPAGDDGSGNHEAD